MLRLPLQLSSGFSWPKYRNKRSKEALSGLACVAGGLAGGRAREQPVKRPKRFIFPRPLAASPLVFMDHALFGPLAQPTN